MSVEETPCPSREDAIHCNCWYDGEACCACSDPPMTVNEKRSQGMTNGCMTDSPTNPDAETGTRRLELWRENASGGQWGDMARGYGYNARYLSDDEHGCAEIGVYPVVYEDRSYGVDMMATYGPAIMEDGIWRPSDSAEIDYEGGSALAFETLEDAQEEADRLGQIDQSYALYLRRKEEG